MNNQPHPPPLASYQHYCSVTPCWEELLDHVGDCSIVVDNPRSHTIAEASSCATGSVREASKEINGKQSFDRWVSVETSPAYFAKNKLSTPIPSLPSTPSLFQLCRRRNSWPTKNFDRWSPAEETCDIITNTAAPVGELKDDTNARIPRRKPSICIEEDDDDDDDEEDGNKSMEIVGSALGQLDWDEIRSLF